MDAVQEAKRLFNETWDLLDKQERTEEDKAAMLHKAHASCYLWSTQGQPLNDARGEWQVSRVYSVLGFHQPALLHGMRSLEICQKNAIGDFDLAFGYEAVARAYALGGDAAKAEEYRSLAVAACEHVAKQDDKSYALSEIESIAI